MKTQQLTHSTGATPKKTSFATRLFAGAALAFLAAPALSLPACAQALEPTHQLVHAGTTVGGTGVAVSADGNTAFTFGNLLWINDVTDPANSQLLSYARLGVEDCCGHVAYQESRELVYTGDGKDLFVVDVSDRTAPVVRGSVTLVPVWGGIGDIVPFGNYVYASASAYPSGGHVAHIIDVSNPANPTIVGEVPTIPANNAVLFLARSGFRLYVGDLIARNVRIFDISTPTAPVLLGIAQAEAVNGIATSGDNVYLLQYRIDRGWIQAIDATNPANPVVYPPLQVGNPAYGVDIPHGIAISGNYLFKNGEVISVVDISNPADIRIVGTSSRDFVSGQWLLAAAGNRVFTGGHVWTLEPLAPPDADGDGVPDDSDACPNSNLGTTVVIGGTDTGVPNVLLAGGCSIQDEIAKCAAGATNHGAFVSRVAQLTNRLVEQGILTGAQKGAIQRAAAGK